MKKLIILACGLLSLNAYALDLKTFNVSNNKSDCSLSMGQGQVKAITAINHKNAMMVNINEYTEVDEDNYILKLGVEQSVTDTAKMVLIRAGEAMEFLEEASTNCTGDDLESTKQMKEIVQGMLDDAQKVITTLE